MTLFFIADLHLSPERPQVTTLFLEFLKEQVLGKAEKLYILGDFFEFWIGDDYIPDEYQSVISALQTIRLHHTHIYLMHGNRDFLIGKKFCKLIGATLLPDPCLIDIDDRKVLLMHGDSLCTADIAYQTFRKKARNWFLQKLFLLKSVQSRLNMANQIRQKSKTESSLKPEDIMDVAETAVIDAFKRHHVPYLIHGHTHRPAVHSYEINDAQYTRYVLGSWDDSTPQNIKILQITQNSWQLRSVG